MADVSEGELLAQIFPLLPHSSAELLGPGDDCAVMSSPDGSYVITMDMLIAGPDFRPEWSSPFDLGFKAAATNLADVAAMGARPTGLVVAIAAPPTTKVSYMLEIARGLNDFCTRFAPGCGVVGGDLSASDTFTIAVTATGSLDGRSAIRRSGAQPGDIIAVAGELGLAGLGLRELAATNAVTDSIGITAQLRPQPPIGLGVAAAEAGATSGMDISDSLALDAGRIAAASKVALVLDESVLDDMAAHRALDCSVDAAVARQAILFGGEEHALLMTFPVGAHLPDGFVQLGHVEAPTEVKPVGVYLGEGRLEEKGWNPFTDWHLA